MYFVVKLVKPKRIEPLPPRKALFGLNIPLSLGIRRVFLRFAGIFILKNHLSSVRGKFQGTIFVSFKAFLRSYMYILQEKITPKGAKIVLETDMSSALFGYKNILLYEKE